MTRLIITYIMVLIIMLMTVSYGLHILHGHDLKKTIENVLMENNKILLKEEILKSSIRQKLYNITRSMPLVDSYEEFGTTHWKLFNQLNELIKKGVTDEMSENNHIRVNVSNYVKSLIDILKMYNIVALLYKEYYEALNDLIIKIVEHYNENLITEKILYNYKRNLFLEYKNLQKLQIVSNIGLEKVDNIINIENNVEEHIRNIEKVLERKNNAVNISKNHGGVYIFDKTNYKEKNKFFNKIKNLKKDVYVNNLKLHVFLLKRRYDKEIYDVCHDIIGGIDNYFDYIESRTLTIFKNGSLDGQYIGLKNRYIILDFKERDIVARYIREYTIQIFVLNMKSQAVKIIEDYLKYSNKFLSMLTIESNFFKRYLESVKIFFKDNKKIEKLIDIQESYQKSIINRLLIEYEYYIIYYRIKYSNNTLIKSIIIED